MKINFNPIARAIAVFGATAALVTSVTFAALNNQATLTNSTISTVSADLRLWDGDSFETTAPGFQVTNLVPGVGSAPQLFYFQNAGGVGLNITVHVPVAPEVPVGGYGFSGWENLKVMFKDRNDNVVTNTDMAALLAGEVPLATAPLPAGAQGNDQAGQESTKGNYSVTFDISPAAVTGSHAGVGNFNMIFTGTQPVGP